MVDTSKLLAVTTFGPPYIYIWNFASTPTTITAPSLSDAPSCSEWSPNGRYLALGFGVSPFIKIFDYNTSSWVGLSNPATLPPNSVTQIAWSPNSRYIAVAHYNSPYVTIYDMNTGSPVKVTNPATIPTAQGTGVAWSPDNRYLAVSFLASPYIFIYDWNTGSPVKKTNPTTLPTGQPYAGISWGGDRVTIGHGANSPYITTYNMSTGTPVKEPNPSHVLTPDGFNRGVQNLRYSANGRYLAVAMFASPHLVIYDWDTGTATKISDPATMPTSDTADFAWSIDGKYLVALGGGGRIYDWTTGSPVKITDPTSWTSSGASVAWGSMEVIEGSHFKTWTGSAWVEGELKRWDGSAWVPAVVQKWNGSSWEDVP